MQLSQVDFKLLTKPAGDELYGQAGGAAYFPELFGMLISILISILGVVLLFFIITAGFYWFTAGGNEAQVEKAKELLKNSVIGMVLILTAYSLSTFIQQALIDRLTQEPAPVEAPATPTP